MAKRNKTQEKLSPYMEKAMRPWEKRGFHLFDKPEVAKQKTPKPENIPASAVRDFDYEGERAALDKILDGKQPKRRK